jgi:putative addiction module component (TIGR02574 family)
MNAIPGDQLHLGTEEKRELNEELWNSLDADSEVPPMSDELFAELERRAKWSKANPGRGTTIQEIARELGVKL